MEYFFCVLRLVMLGKLWNFGGNNCFGINDYELVGNE